MEAVYFLGVQTFVIIVMGVTTLIQNKREQK
jgi:hypothetical protein